MTIQGEFQKFVNRVKAVRDWAVLIFMYVAGIFTGSLMTSLLPMLIIGATVAVILGVVWFAIDQVTQKGES